MGNFSFEHKFYFNGQDVLDFGYSVNEGMKNYAIEISYGGNPFPAGDYCLKIYWGEFGYGAFVFSVISGEKGTEFVGITREGEGEQIENWCSTNLLK
ncbi:MAG: hypothetical protein N3A65_07735 [candidate division WOR-3 bacterium]|nr:hypothetical protein [candidate division WOR-3 bacterium]